MVNDELAFLRSNYYIVILSNKRTQKSMKDLIAFKKKRVSNVRCKYIAMDLCSGR
jgi:hypothetical protein